jgi:hypothetical protein
MARLQLRSGPYRGPVFPATGRLAAVACLRGPPPQRIAMTDLPGYRWHRRALTHYQLQK